MNDTDPPKARADRPGRPGLAVLTVCLTLIAAVAVSCGGGGGAKPSEKFFSGSSDTIRRLVPEATAFTLKTSSGDDTQVDYVVSTALAGNPRIHVVTDEDAIKGAKRLGEYKGHGVYQQKSSFWAQLRADPPLYVSARTRPELETYLDFYSSGKPELSDKRFWNALDYASGRIDKALQESPAGLVLDFNSVLAEGVGGLRVEAELGGRRIYVGALFGAAEPDLSDAIVEEFKARFAVPSGAEELTDANWGYPNRIWYADLTDGE